jgi:flagellar hook protein FlgE
MANFRNPQGLQPLGDNVWARTFASGDPSSACRATATWACCRPARWRSNIDLTGELVNMITAQRIYQANAQTIKTQDQVLQTLVNLR